MSTAVICAFFLFTIFSLKSWFASAFIVHTISLVKTVNFAFFNRTVYAIEVIITKADPILTNSMRWTLIRAFLRINKIYLLVSHNLIPRNQHYISTCLLHSFRLIHNRSDMSLLDSHFQRINYYIRSLNQCISHSRCSFLDISTAHSLFLSRGTRKHKHHSNIKQSITWQTPCPEQLLSQSFNPQSLPPQPGSQMQLPSTHSPWKWQLLGHFCIRIEQSK